MSNKGIKQGLVEVLRAGKHSTRESIAKAADIETDQIATYLSQLRRDGVIEYTNINARKIDYATIRVVGDAPAPTPRKAAARAAKARPAKPVPAAAQGDGDGLEDCVSVTFDASDIEELVKLTTAARTLADALEEFVANISRAPALGADGAYLVRLLAKLHAKGEG